MITLQSMTTKGCGATFVIIDELAYVDPGLWDETIRALLNMKNAGLVGITTPRQNNFVNKLIDMENEDGTPFFNTYTMTTICDTCKQLPTKSEQMGCNHCFVPSYKSKEKQTRNAQIAKVTGSVDITLQEDCGVVVAGSDGSVFDADHINAAFDTRNPDLVFDNDHYIPKRIYTVSDPNADGASNTTMFSFFMAPFKPTGGFERIVVLGVDVDNSRGSEKDELILRHIKHIRNIDRYSKVPIISIFERNTGDFATRGEELVLKNLDSVVALHEGGPEGPVGVWTSEQTKVAGVDILQRWIDNGQLAWSSELFTYSTKFSTRLRQISSRKTKTNAELIKDELKTELMRLRYEKRKITGKINNYQDDMAITMLLAALYITSVESTCTPTYAPYRNLRWVEKLKTPSYFTSSLLF